MLPCDKKQTAQESGVEKPKRFSQRHSHCSTYFPSVAPSSPNSQVFKLSGFAVDVAFFSDPPQAKSWQLLAVTFQALSVPPPRNPTKLQG
jgi:hypothetical protein